MDLATLPFHFQRSSNDAIALANAYKWLERIHPQMPEQYLELWAKVLLDSYDDVLKKRVREEVE